MACSSQGPGDVVLFVTLDLGMDRLVHHQAKLYIGNLTIDSVSKLAILSRIITENSKMYS